MSDEINLLRRKLSEIEAQLNYALSMASLTATRCDELRTALEKLTLRIDGLRVEAKTIAEIIG